MAVIPLVHETKMVDIGILMSQEPIGQESHMICAHNYVRNFDFAPRIWSRLHHKDCLYILLSSKNAFSYIVTYRDSTLSHSLSSLTYRDNTQSHSLTF